MYCETLIIDVSFQKQCHSYFGKPKVFIWTAYSVESSSAENSVRMKEQEITHLYSHGDVLFADIVVMLVSVQHYDSVGQGEACIVGHERRAVHLLQTHK